MKHKLHSRLICALLSVLMLVCIIPTVALPTFAEEKQMTVGENTIKLYDSAEERLAAMEKMYTTVDGRYSLYCDKALGIVAYTDNTTGEILFTNPWDMSKEQGKGEDVIEKMMSQISITFLKGNDKDTYNSFADAAMKGQISVKYIKGGIRVEYSIGELSSRVLVPRQLTEAKYQALKQEFRNNIDYDDPDQRLLYTRWAGYYTEYSTQYEAHRRKYPYLEEQYQYLVGLYGEGKIPRDQHIKIRVLSTDISDIMIRRLESSVKAYLPKYSFEEMDIDHEAVGYFEEATAPALFTMALEYTMDQNGLVVSLPANGLRYDETVYRILDLQILPYMGASLKTNEGYSFIPDGSGALYNLDTQSQQLITLYGPDYALANNLRGQYGETVRMPVFGQVEVFKDAEGNVTDKRGYLAIIEEGDSLASLTLQHLSYADHTSIIPSFVTRETDTSSSNWSVFAYRRYTEDYTIRYVLLSDHASEQGRYDCTWMGMARAYRAYLDSKDNGFERLTDADLAESDSIPLYIESFGCVDTIQKVLSMPVTVSVALTSFDNIETMYEYLLGQNVSNVHFKMTGYANGGLYADTPYKLKWEKSVGGKGGFEELIEYASDKELSLYPDFDFVYTSQADGGSAVRMKQNASRTIDNRYTSRRVYSVTKQDFISYYQMVLSPATYSKFYEKLASHYEKYDLATGISLSTLGSDLNSDFDEEETVLREESKSYVLEALDYFGDKGYDIMVEGGNAYVWNKVDHIIDAPLDSSRYNAEYASIPFYGVVLHGYVQFAGSALNMEGDMQYALLKTIESGAAAYFILSYTNTDLLKEDELLSQNYSVRYDIWQKQLVDVYNELNGLLADVQTKLIIDHEFLNGTRVPDKNEMMQDIMDAAKDQADAIQQAIAAAQEALRQELRRAVENTANAANAINTQKTNITSYLNHLNSQRTNTSGFLPGAADASTAYLRRDWNALTAVYDVANHDALLMERNNLSDQLRTYVINNYVGAKNALALAASTLVEAQEDYQKLIANNALQNLIDAARVGVENAVDAYVELLKVYRGNKTLTLDAADKAAFCNGTKTLEEMEAAIVSTKADLVIDAADAEAFLFAMDSATAMQYVADADLSAGVVATYNAYVDLLVADGLYVVGASATSAIDFEKMLAAAQRPTTGGGSGEEEEEEEIVVDNSAKYSIDNKIACVTYGEENTPYKTFILNFNDYAVQTTYNGVTYTIEAYGYVVIMH